MRTRTLGYLVLISTIGSLSGCVFGNPFIGPRDVVVADAKQAVLDARQLIKEQNDNSAQKPPFREPNELPESLRLPGLRVAIIATDHINLVLTRNPDWNAGARIWSADSTREHRDRPTKYAEIFFYEYNNDFAETPDNIP